MTHPRSRILLLAVLLSIGCGEGGSGCAGCGGAYLAEIEAMQSTVHTDSAGSVGQWTPAKRGHRFSLGDGLRTAAGATAMLAMAPTGRILVEESTTIRFGQEEDGRLKRLVLESGSVEVEASEVGLEVGSAAGLTVLEGGSRVNIKSNAGGTTLAVQAGRAIIEQDDGSSKVVQAGQTLSLEVGEVLIEEDAPDASAPDSQTSAAQQDAGIPTDPGEEADAEAELTGGEEHGADDIILHPVDGAKGEIPIRAGETVTIHSVELPTSLSISFDCEEGAAVELVGKGGRVKKRVAGITYGTLQLAAGNHRYRVRCLHGGRPSSQIKARGRVRVIADAATRRLPTKAHRVSVDADGRHYRVQYSNRLPRVSFGWRDAPPASSYTLTVERPGNRSPLERTSQGKPRAFLPEGTLGEGLYRYHWRAGNTRSKASALEVTFEGMGRTAYLASKLPPGNTPGTLSVSGAALAQSHVTIGGARVPIDIHGRFSTDVPPPESGVVTVRVVHPTTGVHYYLRQVK